jgi:hypothetical protein
MTTKQRWVWAAAIAAWCCGAAFLGSGAADMASEVIAMVGDAPITVADFLREVSRRPGKYDTPAQKDALLDTMLHRELLYRAAQNAGYERDPAIQSRIRRLIADQYRTDRLETLLGAVTVTDGEVSRYYRRHPEAFMTDARVRAAVIRITLPFHASDETLSRLRHRAASARAEAMALPPTVPSFGSVAISYSDHQPSRYRGGDTGWLRAGRPDRRFPKKVLDAVFATERIGKVSPVIETASGLFIVKVMAKQESAPIPLDTAAGRIRQQLQNQKKTDVERTFYDDLKQQYPVQVNHARLEVLTVTPPAGTPPPLPGK